MVMNVRVPNNAESFLTKDLFASQNGPCSVASVSQSVCLSDYLLYQRTHILITQKFLFYKACKPTPGLASFLVEWVPGSLLQGLNHMGHAADTSPRVEVQNAWSYATPSPNLHAVHWGQIWHPASSLKFCMLLRVPFSFISVSRLFWMSDISLV